MSQASQLQEPLNGHPYALEAEGRLTFTWLLGKWLALTPAVQAEMAGLREGNARERCQTSSPARR
jgi:hypothetical protein